MKLSFKNTFAALEYRNYRYWFYGQIISLLGTWMQITAQGFLVYQLTHSSAFLGYVGFAMGVPVWIFSTYAGVLADKYPKRTILMLTQAAQMLLALILAILTFAHIIQPWHLIGLAFLLGIVSAFDAPARQSFVLEMVDRELLTNAIALNAMMFNTGTAIGPAFAGIAYALWGPGWCFLINAISFIGVLVALGMMKLPPHKRPVKSGSTFNQMAEGYRYIRKQKLILTIIVLIMFTCMFSQSFATILPAWAVNKLHGNAATNGFLQSARGIGSVLSALGLATYSQYKRKGMLITISSFCVPIVMFLFSSFAHLAPSLVFLFWQGFFTLIILNLANSTVQTTVADEFRGRVMGIYSMVFMGFLPIGSLVMGTLADSFGEVATIRIHAVILLAVAIAIYYFIPQLRKK